MFFFNLIDVFTEEIWSYMKNKYKKLFIIGNGFDRWQGLPTSYDHFKDYYRKNIWEIVKGFSNVSL